MATVLLDLVTFTPILIFEYVEVSRNANMKLDEIKKSNHPILELSDVFVFRGTKYDDIRPNHTKTKTTKNKKTTKNQHTWFLIFYGPDKELF